MYDYIQIVSRISKSYQPERRFLFLNVASNIILQQRGSQL